MAPPKKNVASSSTQNKNKGKQIASESSIPHFGPVMEMEIVVDPNAFFEVEHIVSWIMT